MILNSEMIKVLKNFSRINNSIYIKANTNEIVTMSPAKNILAKYSECQSFPTDIIVYDLTKWLNIMNSFESFELDFGDNYLLVISGQQRVKMFFADLDLIVYPTKELVMPETAVSFELKEDVLDRISKMAGTLGVSDIRITNTADENKNLVLQVLDSKNSSSSSFNIDLGKAPTKKPFEYYFSVENLRLLPETYTVNLSEKIISEFSAKTLNLKYWIAMNANSVAPAVPEQDDDEMPEDEDDDSRPF